MKISVQSECQEKKKKKVVGLIDRENLNLMGVTEEVERA